jgi:hypothetical protein
MGLRRDEYGFLRSNNYGHTTGPNLRAELGVMPDEQVYHSSARGGVRTSAPVEDEHVSYHPGDTFAVGPKVTKASAPPAVDASGAETPDKGGTEDRPAWLPPVSKPVSWRHRYKNQRGQSRDFPRKSHALGGTRTPNPRFRRPMLYPIELRVLVGRLNRMSIGRGVKIGGARMEDGRAHVAHSP